MTTDTDTPHADDRDVLVITVREDGASIYEEARDAIEALDRRESVEQPDSVTFPNTTMLAQTFTERTLELLGHRRHRPRKHPRDRPPR
jgi:hypothetical protein